MRILDVDDAARFALIAARTWSAAVLWAARLNAQSTRRIAKPEDCPAGADSTVGRMMPRLRDMATGELGGFD